MSRELVDSGCRDARLRDFDAFVSKFDSDGEFLWVNTWGAGPHDIGNPSFCGDTAFGIAIENSNRIYITGGFLDTVDFDPGPGTEIAEGSWHDSFLVKYTSGGLF